jgi:hypothetical protein
MAMQLRAVLAPTDPADKGPKATPRSNARGLPGGAGVGNGGAKTIQLPKTAAGGGALGMTWRPVARLRRLRQVGVSGRGRTVTIETWTSWDFCRYEKSSRAASSPTATPINDDHEAGLPVSTAARRPSPRPPLASKRYRRARRSTRSR